MNNINIIQNDNPMYSYSIPLELVIKKCIITIKQYAKCVGIYLIEERKKSQIKSKLLKVKICQRRKLISYEKQINFIFNAKNKNREYNFNGNYFY